MALPKGWNPAAPGPGVQ